MKKIILFIFLSFYFINLFSQEDKFIELKEDGYSFYFFGAIQVKYGDYYFVETRTNDFSESIIYRYSYYGTLKQKKIIKSENSNRIFLNFIQLTDDDNLICQKIVYNDSITKKGFIEFDTNLEVIKEYGLKIIPSGITGYFREGFRMNDDVKILFFVTLGTDNFIDVYYGDKYYRKFFTGYIYDIQILNDKYFFMYKADEISGKAIVQKIRIEDFSIVKTFNLEQELASVFYLGPDVLFSFDYVMGKYFFIKNDKLYFFNNHQFYAYNDFHEDNDFVVLDIDLENFLKIATPETPEDEQNSNFRDFLAKAVDGSYFALNYLMGGGIRLTKLDSNFDIIFSKIYYIPWSSVNTIIPSIDGGCLVIIDDFYLYNDSYYRYTNFYKFDKDGNVETKKDIIDNTKFVVYPNPVSDILKIQNTQLLQNSEITIFNMYGQKILTKNLDNFLNTIDVSNYETGVYFYWLINKDKVQQKGKFVVQH